jgi:hypothetical protein
MLARARYALSECVRGSRYRLVAPIGTADVGNDTTASTNKPSEFCNNQGLRNYNLQLENPGMTRKLSYCSFPGLFVFLNFFTFIFLRFHPIFPAIFGKLYYSDSEE